MTFAQMAAIGLGCLWLVLLAAYLDVRKQRDRYRRLWQGARAEDRPRRKYRAAPGVCEADDADLEQLVRAARVVGHE